MLSSASVLCSSVVWLNNVSFGLSLHQLSPQYMCRTCILPLPRRGALSVFFHPLVLLNHYPDSTFFCPLAYRGVSAIFFIQAVVFQLTPPIPSLPHAICTAAFESINSDVPFHLFIDASSILQGTWLLPIFSAF